ncbi:M14 family zinc carboxypeptidase, partial [Porphyromonas loveana]
MKKRVFLILGVFVALLASFGSMHAQRAKEYFNFEERGEAYFSFKMPEKKVLAELAQIMSVDKVNAETGTVIAYANEEEFEAFLRYGMKPTILTPPSMERVVEMMDYRPGAKNDWNTYPTYEGYVSMMNEFQANYPSLCTTSSVGKSVKNRELLVCRLTSSVNAGKKPKVFFTSTMHGDETTGYVVMLRLIDYLLSNYETDPRVKNILDKTEVWISPLTNPDGTYRMGNNSVNGATRYNANNIDLNRNFKDDVHGDHPDGKPWQPETQAYMDFQSQHNFVLGMNVHGGAEVVNYPWDNKKER